MNWQEHAVHPRRHPNPTLFQLPQGYFVRIPTEPLQVTTGEEYDNLVDMTKLLTLGGGMVTFGFEAEFRGENVESFVRRTPNGLEARRDIYKFLARDAIVESTGNYEVRSVVYQYAPGCISDMRVIKKALGQDLRSFHLHMRFNKVTIPVSLEEEFLAWVSRIGDAIILWRLQNRKAHLALTTWTQQRRPLRYIQYRGTVRLQIIDGQYDLELRGFMNSSRSIGRLLQVILTGLKYPERIQHAKEFQELSTNENNQMKLRRFFHEYWTPGCRDLTDNDLFLLDDLNNEATYKSRMHVILWGMEEAPYFPESYREQIRARNRQFVRDFETFFVQVEQGQMDKNTQYINYRARLKMWAQDLKISEMMTSTLLLNFLQPGQD
mmetsp:Transcript_34254/g.96529  ORF Transcript_34254/g.96529 Transcript_34254/m.96529 type:complete len:379 (+) Transcript_34254:93-1229(+)|eukprot:CAMPEP_0119119184 /NCGR_PEP_ID=MMETSP1310-20130426/783_1 /TAXON_ID=464262 /ORGANISM="Genus nov. species nov., Strain RCC2339" /LENGTH=378 /DNA_ID=CAMNT_0007108603 /DNA_START=94 /DNA_END=1230 /DNA_ORIENTATION=+